MNQRMSFDKINRITLSLFGLDLLLGLLAIAFVNVTMATASTTASIGSLLFVSAVYKNYGSLKKGVESFGKIYNKSSIAISALDVAVGLITIVASILAAGSAVMSASAAVSGVKFIRILGRVIQVKKAQSLTKAARSVGVAGIIYIILRGGNKMFKKLLEKFVAWVKYIFVVNPVTVILGLGGIALLITNGATGDELINYLTQLINDPAAAEALFYGVGGSALLVAVVKQGLETPGQKDERIKDKVEARHKAEALKRQARITAKAKAELEADKKAKADAEAKAKAEAAERAEIDRVKAELVANGN